MKYEVGKKLVISKETKLKLLKIFSKDKVVEQVWWGQL